MAWPRKRIRLSTGDDNNDNDDNVVVTVTSDVNTSLIDDDVEDKSLQTADEVDVSPTSELKPPMTTIDLTIDPPAACHRNTRRAFPHTAEVIKARYDIYYSEHSCFD